MIPTIEKQSIELKPLGMRTVKTGIAVILTLIISQLSFVMNPVYAVIGTILSIQNTVNDSFKKGFMRIYGTLLGGFIGYLFLTYCPVHPLVIGAAVILTIYICHCLNLNDAITIAVTVCVSILIDLQTQSPLQYSFLRMTDTAIGVFIGLLVNYFIFKPNPSRLLLKEIDEFYQIGVEQFNQLFHCSFITPTELKQTLLKVDYHLEEVSQEERLTKDEDVEQMKEAVEACHDYYFHLKCLNRLVQDFQIPIETRLMIYESSQSHSTLALNEPFEILFDYHLRKLMTLKK